MIHGYYTHGQDSRVVTWNWRIRQFFKTQARILLMRSHSPWRRRPSGDFVGAGFCRKAMLHHLVLAGVAGRHTWRLDRGSRGFFKGTTDYSMGIFYV
jgi:hypothetical protein